jgi:hypothetical protein
MNSRLGLLLDLLQNLGRVLPTDTVGCPWVSLDPLHGSSDAVSQSRGIISSDLDWHRLTDLIDLSLLALVWGVRNDLMGSSLSVAI